MGLEGINIALRQLRSQTKALVVGSSSESRRCVEENVASGLKVQIAPTN